MNSLGPMPSKERCKRIAHVMQATKHSGSCLCGAARFSFTGELDELYFCHCSQCRKNYGLYGAFAGLDRETFVMEKSETLKTFRSSPAVTRSFCGVCGSPLTWDRDGDDRLYVLMGALDGDIKTSGAKNIYAEDKGGYYKICD
jgi:hypothetical protein